MISCKRSGSRYLSSPFIHDGLCSGPGSACTHGQEEAEDENDGRGDIRKVDVQIKQISCHQRPRNISQTGVCRVQAGHVALLILRQLRHLRTDSGTQDVDRQEYQEGYKEYEPVFMHEQG